MVAVNSQSFTEALRKPYLLKDYSISELQEMAEKHPYSSAINVLIALKAHQQNDSGYEHYLSSAAIRVPDRKRLYHLIHSGFSEQEIIEAPPPETEEVAAEKAIAPIQTEEMPKDSLIKVTFEEKEKPGEKREDPEVTKQPAEEKPFVLPGVEETAEALKSISAGEEVRSVEPAPVEQRENQEIIKPDDNRHSFAEWLSLMKKDQPARSPVMRKIQESNTSETIEFSRNAISEKDDSDMEQKAKESLSDNLEWVTETLAKIYELQKKYDKAEEAYRMLSLKYPDKKAYFAQRIDNLRKFKS